MPGSSVLLRSGFPSLFHFLMSVASSLLGELLWTPSILVRVFARYDTHSKNASLSSWRCKGCPNGYAVGDIRS